jgi:hypothetical protein
MKNLYLIYRFSLMVFLLTPAFANAQSENAQLNTLWNFQPRLTTGVMGYKFDYAFTAPDATKKSELSIDDHMPFIGGGAMLAYDKCFADTYFQKTLVTGNDGGGTEKKDDTESVLSKPVNRFDRMDYAITLGCQVSNYLSFFAGYKYGQTDIHTASTQKWPYDRIDKTSISETEFESDGLFLGAAFSYPIGNGLLGLKVAAAKLEAEYNQHNFTVENNRAVGDDPKKKSGDDWFLLGNTLGWTFGLNWTYPINRHLYYRISADYFDYDFDTDSAYVIRDDKAEFIDILGGGVDYDMKETVYSLQLQLLYQF